MHPKKAVVYLVSSAVVSQISLEKREEKQQLEGQVGKGCCRTFAQRNTIFAIGSSLQHVIIYDMITSCLHLPSVFLGRALASSPHKGKGARGFAMNVF